MQGREFLLCYLLLPVFSFSEEVADVTLQLLSEDNSCNQFFSPEVRLSEARMAGTGVICVKGERVVVPVPDPDEEDKQAPDEGLHRLHGLPAPASGKKHCKSGRKSGSAPNDQKFTPPA